VFQILGVSSGQLSYDNGRLGKNVDGFLQKKIQGFPVDRNDGIDLEAGVLAAQVIGKCLGDGWVLEARPIQVLIV